MATLKSQLEKATRELNQAENILKAREADTQDTRYGKFDPNSTYGKDALAKLTAAGAAYNKAKTDSYNNIVPGWKKKNIGWKQDHLKSLQTAVNKLQKKLTQSTI